MNARSAKEQIEKGKEMKTNGINPVARFSGLFIALALFAGVAGEVRAQETGSAKGGARLLMRPESLPSRSDYKPMACGKCKNDYVTRKDWSARGANKPNVIVTRHLCVGCETTIATQGHGKAKHEVATHKCTSCGAETLACCATKKGSETVTKGMEKKFEIAPLK
jgi:hypothetical protein